MRGAALGACKPQAMQSVTEGNRKEMVGEGNVENKCGNGFRNRTSEGLPEGQSRICSEEKKQAELQRVSVAGEWTERRWI